MSETQAKYRSRTFKRLNFLILSLRKAPLMASQLSPPRSGVQVATTRALAKLTGFRGFWSRPLQHPRPDLHLQERTSPLDREPAQDHQRRH